MNENNVRQILPVTEDQKRQTISLPERTNPRTTPDVPPSPSLKPPLQMPTPKSAKHIHPVTGLLPGWEWNPLLTLPPNRTCPCLSGVKFKKCCREKLPKAVKAEHAKMFREQMAKPDLVFITHENAERLAAQGAVNAESNEESATTGDTEKVIQ